MYEIKIPDVVLNDLPTEQHEKYRWFTVLEAKEESETTKASKDTPRVHKYVLPYFEEQPLTDIQDKCLNTRRDSFNQLIWQTPALSLTAQSFLLTIALNPSVTDAVRMISSGLSLITAIASAQLLVKHRFGEREYAIKLQNFEAKQGLHPMNQRLITEKMTPIERWSSYRLWLGMLIIFGICALFILISTLFTLKLFVPPYVPIVTVLHH